MSFGDALAIVEEVLLNVIENREPSTAGRVRDDLAIGASSTFLDDGT